MLMVRNISVEDPRDVEVWNYLGVLGPQVNALKFCQHDNAELLYSLLDILPNINYLSTCRHMHMTSPITNVLTSIMSRKEKAKSQLVVSCMTLPVLSGVDLEDLEKFADRTNIMIEDLELLPGTVFYSDPNIPNLQARFLSVLSKILYTSRKILKKLILFSCEFYLSLLEFPCMAELTDLDMQFSPHTPGQVGTCKFSPSFRFSDKVPNLQSIAIRFIRFQGAPIAGDFVGNLLEHTGTAPSVSRVRYSDSFSGFEIAPLFRVFHNVTDFHAIEPGCSQTMLNSLWKYGVNLKKLSIFFNVQRSNENVADLDSIFTGMALESVDKIKKSPKLAPYTVEKMVKLRANPSILDIKELQDLTIYFHINGQNRLPKKTLAFVADYGFKLMPKNPRITILVIDAGILRECALAALDQVSKLPNIYVDWWPDYTRYIGDD